MKKPLSVSLPSSRPKVSIIIPAKNEEKYLFKTLTYLLRIKEKEYSNLEIIVGVSPSIDRTKEIAQKYADKAVEVGLGPSKARNEAFLHSTGEIIIFLDADSIPLPGTISEIAKKVKVNTIGTCAVRPDSDTWKAKFLGCYKNFIRRWFHRGCSELIFCHRNILEEHKIFFNPNMKMGEIHDFFRTATRKAGARYLYLSNVFYQFSVRRYKSLGYLRVMTFWLLWWLFKYFSKIRLTVENKYWETK